MIEVTLFCSIWYVIGYVFTILWMRELYYVSIGDMFTALLIAFLGPVMLCPWARERFDMKYTVVFKQRRRY